MAARAILVESRGADLERHRIAPIGICIPPSIAERLEPRRIDRLRSHVAVSQSATECDGDHDGQDTCTMREFMSSHGVPTQFQSRYWEGTDASQRRVLYFGADDACDVATTVDSTQSDAVHDSE